MTTTRNARSVGWGSTVTVVVVARSVVVVVAGSVVVTAAVVVEVVDPIEVLVVDAGKIASAPSPEHAETTSMMPRRTRVW